MGTKYTHLGALLVVWLTCRLGAGGGLAQMGRPQRRLHDG